MLKWVGSFTITHVLGRNAYWLELPKGMCVHSVFHTSLLCHYEEPETDTLALVPPKVYASLELDCDGTPIYAAERVLDHHTICKRKDNPSDRQECLPG